MPEPIAMPTGSCGAKRLAGATNSGLSAKKQNFYNSAVVGGGFDLGRDEEKT